MHTLLCYLSVLNYLCRFLVAGNCSIQKTRCDRPFKLQSQRGQHFPSSKISSKPDEWSIVKHRSVLGECVGSSLPAISPSMAFQSPVLFLLSPFPLCSGVLFLAHRIDTIPSYNAEYEAIMASYIQYAVCRKEDPTFGSVIFRTWCQVFSSLLVLKIGVGEYVIPKQFPK